MTASAKRTLANLALLVVALAFAFALGEGAVRLIYKDQTVLFPRYHTDYRYGRYTIRGIRPSAEFWHTSVDGSWKFVTNSKGFRNTSEFSYTKPANTFRVVSLGDSQTHGYEVRQDQTFSAILERFLTHQRIATEVINAGVSGFSNAEALVFLENEGVSYNPDAVVLAFYANDFDDNLKAGLFSLDGAGRLKEERFEHIPGVRIQNAIYSIRPIRWLSENSYFYSLFFNHVWEYFKARLAERTKQQQAGEAVSPGEAVGAPEYAVPTSARRSTHEVELAAALLARMQQICKERGIRFIVVDVPVLQRPYRHVSSLPQQLVDKLNALGIELIGSQTLFPDLDGAAELHVPHGHNHVSELTHTLIGLEVGRRLLTSARAPPR